jgi:hypothetical protein
MIHAGRALAKGLGAVLTAPLLLLAVMLVTMAAAAPFGVVLGNRLQSAFASQSLQPGEAAEIDAEWWMEFRSHAQGLEATFTPAVIGFAAPLDNLSALADGTARPAALAVLWGVILERFHRGRGVRAGELVARGFAHAPRFAAIALAAAAVHLLLYQTVHRLLFGPVFNMLSASAGSERDAFFWRLALYAMFGALLITVSLVADYARASSVVVGHRTLRESLAAGIHFVRANRLAVFTLYLMTGLLFVGLLVGYGVAETMGGSRLGGWRAIGVAQAYIFGRLAIRLAFGASEVKLLQALGTRS